MKSAANSRGVSKNLARPALWFCVCHLLAATLSAQCTNVSQVPNQTISSGTPCYSNNDTLTAAGVTINGSASVSFVAGNTVHLDPGFRATAGTARTTFHAWVETAPAAVSVLPPSSTGLSQAFTWTVSSPSGYSNISDVYALFNTSISGANACYIHYNRATNLLSVADSSGSNWSTGIVPGSSDTTGTFGPNCTVNGIGSSVSPSGTQLALTTSVTFQSTFSGTKNRYLIAYDNAGLNTTWQQFGTWTVAYIPTVFTPIRISAGGPYTDLLGQFWSVDYGYAEHGTFYSTTATISATLDPTLYRFERYSYPGSLVYPFTVPNGSYTVTLKFAEIFETAPGRRLMDVALNGTTVVRNLDVYTVAGGPNRAYDLILPVSVTDKPVNNHADVHEQQLCRGKFYPGPGGFSSAAVLPHYCGEPLWSREYDSVVSQRVSIHERVPSADHSHPNKRISVQRLHWQRKQLLQSPYRHDEQPDGSNG
jgi:hypothetical protein